MLCGLYSNSPAVRPSEFSPILPWSEERGEALEGLYVYVLRWFLYTTEGTLYPSLHPRTIVLVHGALVVRSYVLLTKKRVALSLWDGPDKIRHEGMSTKCPGSYAGEVKSFCL